MIKKLSLYLKLEMRRQGINASELAKRCDNQISADYIRKIRNQVPKSVTLDTIIILSKGLQVSLKQLLVESMIIDNYDHYGLSVDEATKLIDSIFTSPNLKINLNDLTSVEKLTLGNHIYEYINMISKWYKGK